MTLSQQPPCHCVGPCFRRRVAHHAGHGTGPPGRTVGPVLRPVQLRGRHRETGPEPVAGADYVVRPVGQRPGTGAAPVGQRPADAARAGRRATADAAPVHQVQAETGVPHVVQPGRRDDGVGGGGHGRPVFAGVAAHRRRPVRQQPGAARAHARQANGQVAAPAADRAQGDRHRTSGHRRRTAAGDGDDGRGRARQKAQEQETMIGRHRRPPPVLGDGCRSHT